MTTSSVASSDSLPIATMIHMVSIKLTSANFLLWKRQIIPMLTSFELLGYIDGTTPAPSATIVSAACDITANPAYSKWLSVDQRILAVLFSSLSEEAMAEVVECTSSRDAWVALEAALSHSSTSRVNQLREELLSLRRGSMSVKDYGVRFKGICDQLSIVGKPVDESDKSHWILRGLGALLQISRTLVCRCNPLPRFPLCCIKPYSLILCRNLWNRRILLHPWLSWLPPTMVLLLEILPLGHRNLLRAEMVAVVVLVVVVAAEEAAPVVVTRWRSTS